MKSIRYIISNKLKNRIGESIAETLIALLISSLALLMLAVAISTATDIIQKSRDSIQKYYDASDVLAELPESYTEDDKARVSVIENATITFGTSSETIDIIYAENKAFVRIPVGSYRVNRVHG